MRVSDSETRPGLMPGFPGLGMKAFEEALLDMGLAATAEDAVVVREWLEFFSRWPGRRVIGFTDPRETAAKLIADAYAVRRLREVPGMGPTVDLGSGNGWPGLALRPRGEVFLLDSRAGACDFMRGFVERSLLSGVNVVEARAEEAGQRTPFRGSFPIVTSRAMAVPSIAAEVSAPFLVRGGSAVLWLGPSQKGPVTVHGDIPECGLSLAEVDTYSLPWAMGQRVLAVYRKVAKCRTGFPRKFADIKAKPLF